MPDVEVVRHELEYGPLKRVLGREVPLEPSLVLRVLHLDPDVAGAAPFRGPHEATVLDLELHLCLLPVEPSDQGFSWIWVWIGTTSFLGKRETKNPPVVGGSAHAGRPRSAGRALDNKYEGGEDLLRRRAGHLFLGSFVGRTGLSDVAEVRRSIGKSSSMSTRH